MVDIIPFRGFRPPAELVSKVAAVPYDVVSDAEAKEITHPNEHSFLHVEKSEVDVEFYSDAHDAKIYAKGAENLRRFFKEGWLQRDNSPSFYVYSQRLGKHRQFGIVAGASIPEYQNEIIKKHEKTRADKEQDRIHHVDALNANTGPVFLTYKHRKSIDEIVEKVCQQKPCYDFTTDDTVQHTFWVIAEPEVTQKIRQEFSQVEALYIADGHHRAAAASKVSEMRKAKNPLHTGEEQYNYFLTVIFPDNQMQIMAYNRVVKTLNGLSHEDFLKKLEEKFEVELATDGNPKAVHEIGMFLGGKWYCLKVKPAFLQKDDVVERLDVSILQNLVLSPLLSIEDPRKDQRISFVGGIRGIKALEDGVKKEKDGVAFSLYPVSIADLMAISDASRMMPPKSTWFEPKLRSGVIVKALV